MATAFSIANIPVHSPIPRASNPPAVIVYAGFAQTTSSEQHVSPRILKQSESPQTDSHDPSRSYADPGSMQLRGSGTQALRMRANFLPQPALIKRIALHMRALTVFILHLLFAFALVGTASASTHSSTPAANHAVTPSDAEIEATLRAKLAKSKVGKDGFKFHVSHGVVTWEGSTGIMQHKGSATRMAHSAGAAKVINNIQVTGTAKPFASLKKAEVVQ